MRTLFVLVCLFIVSCGNNHECSITSHGVCVNTREYNITQGAIDYALEIAIVSYSNRFGSLDFDDVAKEESVYLEFETSDEVKGFCGLALSEGCCSSTYDEMFATGYDIVSVVSCFRVVKVVAHETLHILAYHDGYAQNKDHLEPLGLFVQSKSRIQQEETVEDGIVTLAKEFCYEAFEK